jgi:hypothetical protein
MKKIIYLTFPLYLILACGGNDQPSESDKIEIEIEKESIIENWDAIMLQYYDMDNDNFKNTVEYDMIKDKTYSQYDEVAKMAKSYMDSVENLNLKVLEGNYGDFFMYAKEQGWDKISKEDLITIENTLKTKSDEFSSSSLYRHPTSPKFVNYNGFFLYYSKSGNEIPNLYLRAQYSAEDWLFINEAKISVDGDVYTFDIEEWERDNASGEIFEWGTEKVKYFNLLTHILKGNNIKIRYIGDQYHDDRVINSSQKSALREVLKVYYGLYLKDKIKLDK